MSADAYVHHSEGSGSPLLFTFHGTGGNEHQFTTLGRQLLPAARIVSPRGDVSEGGALRYFRRTGEGVYDMDDFARATAKMAGFVAAHAGKTRPVLGLGYSNGANILASVVFGHPELFDGAVLMHPLIPFTPPPQPGLKGKSVLITAGRGDPIAPTARTEALARWFAEQGTSVEVAWHAGGHEVAQSELAAIAQFFERVLASAD